MNLGQWLHKNSPTILTVIAAVGTGAPAVLAAMATPDAIKSKEQAQQEKGEEKLTLWETVKAEVPAYIPAAAVGTGTIACIFGANILNQRQQASITSAYAVLNEMYGKYRKISLERPEIELLFRQLSRMNGIKTRIDRHGTRCRPFILNPMASSSSEQCRKCLKRSIISTEI